MGAWTIRTRWLAWREAHPRPATLGWLGLGILGAWVLLGPRTTVGGTVYSDATWVMVIGAAWLGAMLGARTARHRPRVAVALGAIVAILAVALILDPVPARQTLHLLWHIGPLRLEPTVRAGAFPLGLGAGVFLVAFGIGRLRAVSFRSIELLAVAAVTCWVMADVVVLLSRAMRDLDLYLGAGRAFLEGRVPYTLDPITVIPKDLTTLPFLYPPPTIPFFATLAALPIPVVTVTWLLATVTATIVTLRSFGVRWPWVPIFFLWPPIFEGIWVGNIAILAVVLVAVAPRFPAGLVLGVLSKVQFGVPSLWLVRERRWRSLALGVGLAVVASLVTLPLVGVESWRQWVEGLRAFQDAQAAFPALYALALPRWMPYSAYLAVAIAAVVAATIFGRGLRGLARLAVASIAASPSLYRHGFVAVLPGLLGNGEIVVWLALGLATTAPFGWWTLVVAAALGTFRHRAADDSATVHPLGAGGEPWGTLAPDERSPTGNPALPVALTPPPDPRPRLGDQASSSARLRSASRSAMPSIPTDRRTSAGSTSSGDPAVDRWVIAAGTSIRDSTPPSDSARVNRRVPSAIATARPAASRFATPPAAGMNETIPPKPG